MPVRRRLAQAAGLDLKAIAGSGPHGRVIKADVDAARGKAPSFAKASEDKPAAAPARQVQSLEQQGIPAGSYDLIPLDGMRKTIARRMTDSFRDVPHFPLSIDIELDELLAARTKINAMLEKQGIGHRFKEAINSLAVVDAAIRTLKVMIAKDMADTSSDSWAKAVGPATSAYNSNSHPAIMNSAPEDVKKTPALEFELEKQSGYDFAANHNTNQSRIDKLRELAPSGSSCLDRRGIAQDNHVTARKYMNS